MKKLPKISFLILLTFLNISDVKSSMDQSIYDFEEVVDLCGFEKAVIFCLSAENSGCPAIELKHYREAIKPIIHKIILDYDNFSTLAIKRACGFAARWKMTDLIDGIKCLTTEENWIFNWHARTSFVALCPVDRISEAFDLIVTPDQYMRIAILREFEERVDFDPLLLQLWCNKQKQLDKYREVPIVTDDFIEEINITIVKISENKRHKVIQNNSEFDFADYEIIKKAFPNLVRQVKPKDVSNIFLDSSDFKESLRFFQDNDVDVLPSILNRLVNCSNCGYNLLRGPIVFGCELYPDKVLILINNLTLHEDERVRSLTVYYYSKTCPIEDLPKVKVYLQSQNQNIRDSYLRAIRARTDISTQYLTN
ncbi:hypothetical protein K8T06_08050 [bacterium]|nr:hypothetical protein [bacterium]